MQDYGESNRKFDSFMQIDLKYFFPNWNALTKTFTIVILSRKFL